MEYPKTYATDLHATGLRGPRRSSLEYDEPPLLRRRTGSRVNSPTHSDQERPLDEFRDFVSAPRSFSHEIAGANGHCKLGNNAKLGLFDSMLLTPVAADPNTVSNTRLSTPIEFCEAQHYSQVAREGPEASRSAPGGSYDSAVSTESATTKVVSPGGCNSQTGTKLGPMINSFTQKGPKPSPLNASGIGSLGDLDLAPRKPADAGLFTRGIGRLGRLLRLDWFHRRANLRRCLLFSALSVFLCGIGGLVCAIMTWFRTWKNADVMFVADHDILILLTLASSIFIFTALTGLTGTLLSSRPILAFYALLLLPCFIAMYAIGWIAYGRSAFALEQKLDLSWGQHYTPLGRLMIQNALQCCGWSGSLDEGTPSATCYPRTSLPGCKGPLLTFEHGNLRLVWRTVFSLIPMHIIHMFVVIYCADHFTRTSRAGTTLKKHRLTLMDVNWFMGLGGPEIGGVRRPSIVRAETSVAFGETREETMGLLEAYFQEIREQ